VDFKVGVITYRCMRGTAPEYLSDMFTSVTDDPDCRHLYCAVHGDIAVPWTYTKTLGWCSFAVKGRVIQNGLPTAIHNMDLSLSSFHVELKMFYFHGAYVHNQVRSWWSSTTTRREHQIFELNWTVSTICIKPLHTTN